MDKSKLNKPLKTLQALEASDEIPSAAVKNIVKYLKQNKADNKYAPVYKAFGRAILSSEVKNSLLVSWLKQFNDNIFFLKKENEEIVGYLLRLDWSHKSEEVISVYQELVLNMVSAHSFYLHAVLEMLIKFFSTSEDEADYVTEKEKERFSKGHYILKGIINLIPTAPKLLCKMLYKKYPYSKRSTHMHVYYVTNVLEISTYLPAHRRTILEGLLIKLIQLDVLCPRSRIEIEELEDSDTDEKTFPMDHDGATISKEQDHMKNPLAKTLDVLMDSLFQYVRHVCFKEDGKVLNWEATKKLYKEILTLFDKLILTTYGNAYVQFIMFYICSLKPDLQEGYIDYLWKKAQNPNTAPVLRQAAAYYLGSFLARASYVSANTVTVCLNLMCHWIHQYVDNQSCHNYIDCSVHGTFYVVCQAVFYVFAFRHKDLVEMKNGLKILQNFNFERIISCKLNPLKVCLPAIVQNFADVTRSYQLAYCYTVIKKNNRNLVSHVVQDSDGITEPVKVTVEFLFPFDPYLLKCSRKWIEPIYRVYDAGAHEQSCNQEEDFMMEETSSPSPIKPSFTNYSSSLSSRPLFSPSNS